MKSFPALYKMTCTGAIQKWKITAYNTEIPSYEIVHGQINGVKQRFITHVSSGKNLGHSNETTAYQQACLEAESKWKKQRDRKGYSETIPTEKPLRPMLAKKFDEDGHKIKYLAASQPKLDGHRCMANINNSIIKLTSRANTLITVLGHIEDQLRKLTNRNIILDGELYKHGIPLQKISKAVKRDTAIDLTKRIEYWIYDCFNPNDLTWKFKDRLNFLKQLSFKELSHIRLVDTRFVKSEKELKPAHDYLVSKGFEGLIIRNLHGTYKLNGRSDDLQKYKAFEDAEFQIIDAIEGKGKNKGMCTFICITDKGKEFGAMPKGSEAERKQYFQDWQSGGINKGDLLTVKYFGWTEEEKPFHPVGLALRDKAEIDYDH